MQNLTCVRGISLLPCWCPRRVFGHSTRYFIFTGFVTCHGALRCPHRTHLFIYLFILKQRKRVWGETTERDRDIRVLLYVLLL